MGVAFLIRFNSMYPYLTFFRELVLYGALAAPHLWLGCMGFSVLSVAVGPTVFRKLQRNFILYL